jgi:hypothetical protein
MESTLDEPGPKTMRKRNNLHPHMILYTMGKTPPLSTPGLHCVCASIGTKTVTEKETAELVDSGKPPKKKIKKLGGWGRTA